MAGLVDRMIRASKLDANLYEEVEADKEAMGQAVIVVLLSSIAAGIGTVGVLGFGGIIATMVGALIGWFIWAFLTYIIGTRFLPEPETNADMGEMLRTIGFSSSPGVLRILALIPVVGAFISFGVGIWMLVAMIIAVKQALDYKSTWRAVGVCLIGFIVYFLIFFLIFSIFGIKPTIDAGT
ncbi:MAG: YIP1 family protein [Thermodesulfobacteriota bacterium]